MKAIAWGLALLLGGIAGAGAQTGPDPDRQAVEDVATGSRILADLGVLDGFGHVSARSAKDPTRFLMSRSIAPALVGPGDVMEFDRDGKPVDPQGRAVFLERFIHAAIYRARPDVMAVVHTHSANVIPFGVTKTGLVAMYHNAAFLAGGVPVFEIRDGFGETDMLVRDNAIGDALARTLADRPVALMRGHGDVTVGPSVVTAVFRAYYTDVSARMQIQAVGLGGPIQALTPAEGVKAEAVNAQIQGRAWELWKTRIAR